VPWHHFRGIFVPRAIVCAAAPSTAHSSKFTQNCLFLKTNYARRLYIHASYLLAIQENGGEDYMYVKRDLYDSVPMINKGEVS
jgi:hypothetical protein